MLFNDKFYPTKLDKLVSIFLKQISENEVLGIPKALFFKAANNDFYKLDYLNKKIDNPIGVAAGPQTQLAQNIVTAWLLGARFIELKTVQTLDELEVSKPCIDMQDEGYNCEWSQELKIKEAFNEYLNAWIIIHILADKLGFDNTGMIFNMSVGYDLKGIMQPNVQWFLDKMNNCSEELNAKIKEIKNIYPKIENLKIPSQISDNITLSTMHGCPPDEIEQIASYLISERKINTNIKLNPTLLGSEMIHKILLQNGFKTNVPFSAFEHDLKYPDALKIIRNLLKLSAENNVFFGIKLTNTLESTNNKDIFDKKNEMMYMSGKALHPISINIAKKIQNEFNGELNISFSGGADAFNIADIISCGLKPVTVSSDLLKPGGYGRLKQYFDNLKQEAENSKNIEDFINKKNLNKHKNSKLNALDNLNRYAEEVLMSESFKKESFHEPSIKINRELTKFDCIEAPCKFTCPTNQNIPQYMYLLQKNENQKALEIILQDNPFPAVTGYICDHICQEKCTRINYDKPLNIRDIKRFIADNTKHQKTQINKNLITSKVAVIGAGPAGLSAAYYLSKYGFKVEIFESKPNPGGMLANAIPKFRLPDEKIEIDINNILELGVKINYKQEVDSNKFDELRKNFEFIFVAAGMQASLKVDIYDFNISGVYDPLKFFYKIRNDYNKDIGKKVAVIGGGNTAMDAARVAKRLVGKNGQVYILYRRTKEFMPANYEEIVETINEGVKIVELVEPEELITEKGKLVGIKLIRTTLVETEAGRPKPIKNPDTSFEMEIDSVIPALGQQKDFSFLNAPDFKNKTIPFTNIENIFIGGDAVRGAASAIKAIADGKNTAFEIIKRKNPDFKVEKTEIKKQISYTDLKIKRALRTAPVKMKELNFDERFNFNQINETYNFEQAKKEAERCLLCDELCDICVSVCPNMANQSYEVEPLKVKLDKIVIVGQRQTQVFDVELEIKQKKQTYNIADWCNECGNCATFCPSSGKPYLDKPKVHLSNESFIQSPFGYFITKHNDETLVKFKDGFLIHKLTVSKELVTYENDCINVDFDKNFNILDFSIKRVKEEILLRNAFEMFVVSHININH